MAGRQTEASAALAWETDVPFVRDQFAETIYIAGHFTFLQRSPTPKRHLARSFGAPS